jgi:predicted transcriptional regulator
MASPSKKQGAEKKPLETIAVKLEADLRRKVQEIAQSEERTVSQIARMAIREFVERKSAHRAA